jgi:putative Mn2+ efflux pump MntP
VVLGGIILIGVGIHTIREASEVEKEIEHVSFGSVRSSFLAGLAISTDELAIGFPMGASRLPIPTVLMAIALQAFFVTALGIAIGNRFGSGLGLRASRYAGMAAGIVFSLVGMWIIAERVLGK